MNLSSQSYQNTKRNPSSTVFQDSLKETQKDSESIFNILWNDLVTIEFDIHQDITSSQQGWSTLVKFPIKIDWEDFIIALAISDALLPLCPQYSDRPHPLSNNGWKILKVTDFVRTDIHPNSTLILFKDNSSRPTFTNNSFWNWIRKRIPTNHPLSTI